MTAIIREVLDAARCACGHVPAGHGSMGCSMCGCRSRWADALLSSDFWAKIALDEALVDRVARGYLARSTNSGAVTPYQMRAFFDSLAAALTEKGERVEVWHEHQMVGPIDAMREDTTGCRACKGTCRRCGGEPSFVTASGVVVHNDCPGEGN